MTIPSYDIAIAGAGPAGSAAAYFLAKAGLSVVLLDKAEFPRDKPCGDGLTPRAIKLLSSMGVLEEVERDAFRCTGVAVRHSERVTFELELEQLAAELPRYCLVKSRLSLDDLLRKHAARAGADFRPGVKVINIVPAAGDMLHVLLDGPEPIACRVGIVATGASITLGKSLGSANVRAAPGRAARGYFENVEGLHRDIVIFFDEIELPGYGWVFPISPTSANVGCGVFSASRTAQPTQLRHLIRNHPYLKCILRNARQVEPIRGYALRTDFSPVHSGKGRVLVVGESVGLVNPITGEGVDYALESAKIAADSILESWSEAVPGVSVQRRYRFALARRFRYRQTLNHLAQKMYFRRSMLDNLLKRAQRSSYLRNAILQACFGSTNPGVLMGPRTLWEVFGPRTFEAREPTESRESAR